MRPGRELDTLIAQDVFNHRVYVKKRVLFEETPQGERPLRHYSKDVQWAWEVAEKMMISILPIEGGQWFAMVGKPDGWRSPADFIQYLQEGKFMGTGAGIAETPALAVCLAAARAIESRRTLAEGKDLPQQFEENASLH